MTATPDRVDAYLAECRRVIAEHGWMVQGVFPTEDAPGAPFAYTIGMTVAGLPEMVISGLAANTAGAILNTAALLHLDRELRAGQTVDGAASVTFRVVAAPTAEVNTARNLYGAAAVSALQLVWPDKDGAYP